MKKAIFIVSLFVLNILTIHSVSGQSAKFKSEYSQQDFEKNKVFDETYNLWQYRNKLVSKKNDTLPLPYFVDDRDYKGLINYGVTFRSRDYRNFNFTEGLYMYFLKVDFEKAIFNPNDSTIEIEGYVSGGWGDLSKNEAIGNNIEVFLGEKADTTKNCYYSKVVNEEFIEVKLNNREIDEMTVLDTFSAFYFKNYSHYRTLPKGRRPFKIKGKITNNTLLAFGGKNCYSEIFDLSAMVYYPDKNARKRIKKRDDLAYRTLIVNNKRLSDIEKEKTKGNELKYYTYTEKAENHILRRQYADAKETYLLIAKEYKTLFARDIHNAIRCAILSRDYENAYYWGEKLAAKAIPFSYFNAAIFNKVKSSTGWKSFSLRYDSIYHLTESALNIQLKKGLEELVYEDQADYGLDNRKEPKILFETTEIVTGKLINLLKKEGYPSEEKIGVSTLNDTTLVFAPDYHVLIRHAMQQKPKDLNILEALLKVSSDSLEFDSKRSVVNILYNNSCFHIYKGNLYNSKSCGSNDLMVKKMKFIFNNPYNFLIHTENYVVIEEDKDNPEESDRYYKDNFNFIMKLSDDWKF